MKTESPVRIPINLSFFYVLDTYSPDFPLAIHKTQLSSDGSGSLVGLRSKNVFQCPLWQGSSLAMDHWSSATAPVRWNLSSLLRRCLTELTGCILDIWLYASSCSFVKGISLDPLPPRAKHATCVCVFHLIPSTNKPEDPRFGAYLNQLLLGRLHYNRALNRGQPFEPLRRQPLDLPLV
ncbi:hypothetical protein CSPX01_16965 [Colletotrichum filicis]|nr:hypothetical protein CSPX01_16965 [Colletotrichum filicis]